MGLRRIADRCADTIIAALALGSASKWSALFADKLCPIAEVAGIRFRARSTLELWRARTLLTKEPETIAWIDAMPAGSVLWDIGANVGCYSIYAAKRGVRVIAFEPEAENFAALNANIRLNGLSIMALPIALAERTRIDTLRLSAVGSGAALHCFGTNLDYRRKTFTPAFEQGCVAFSMDELSRRLGRPDFVKIDVDGIEGAIVKGGADTLPHVQGVLVEVNPVDDDVTEVLADHGLLVTECGQWHGPHSRNMIFRRDTPFQSFDALVKLKNVEG